ncbi:hypothetical protein LTR43_012697, partial [Exophiala xenobiotica]
MDEKGCMRGGSVGKATKAVYKAGTRATTIACADRKWVSFIEFVSATGIVGDPFVITD